jgi:hypothetical protein
MRKTTVRSLTAKGYSQYKIAKILKIRKSKVVAAQHRLKIGVRAPEKGAVKFWKQVAMRKESEEVTWKEAIKETKYTKYWFERRQKRLTGVEKARDAMGEKWDRIKRGQGLTKFWNEPEGEEMMEAAEYD